MSVEKFSLEIEIGNDEMHTPEQVAAAIVAVAKHIRGIDVKKQDDGSIRDINGNTVGKWELT